MSFASLDWWRSGAPSGGVSIALELTCNAESGGSTVEIALPAGLIYLHLPPQSALFWRLHSQPSVHTPSSLHLQAELKGAIGTLQEQNSHVALPSWKLLILSKVLRVFHLDSVIKSLEGQ